MKRKVGLLFGIEPRRAWLRLIISSAALTALICLLGQLFLRSFYKLLEFDLDFYNIFKQISSANVKMTSPVLTVAVLAFFFVLALCVLWQKGTVGKVASVFVGAVLLFVTLLASVLFTRVNGVMFFDVVRTLIPLLASGAL